MNSAVRSIVRLAMAAAACEALLAAGLPSAGAAPESDVQGYLNSTARCSSADAMVVFGSTDSSRVAICETPDGYEYRGVRVSDGARLIVPAEASGDGTFVAGNGGIGYMVTAKSLVVSEGNKVIREEPMVDFHGPQAPAPAAAPATPTPTTPLPPPLPAEEGHGG
jgi:hypothetical protein